MTTVTFTFTRTETFTIIHARQLASKVAADMHLCASFYGKPSEEQIRDFAEELAQYLKAGYVAEYEFGFAREGKRIVSWHYGVSGSGLVTSDDGAGNVFAHADIAGAGFFNFMRYSMQFSNLSSGEQADFQAGLPVRRIEGNPPSDGAGSWTSDRNYFSGGLALGRRTFKPRT
jgi:Bacterial HORMA domain family 1